MPSYWIGQLEEETEGEGTIRIVRRAEDEDVKAQGLRYSLENADDTEGQMPRAFSLEPEGDDTIGHPRLRFLEPIDKDQGLYLVEVDSDEDVTGQAFRHS